MAAALTAAVLATARAPAAAVTNGNLDGNGHPMGALMVAQDAEGEAVWRCSGTFISPTEYLTAGHCTEAPASHRLHRPRLAAALEQQQHRRDLLR